MKLKIELKKDSRKTVSLALVVIMFLYLLSGCKEEEGPKPLDVEVAISAEVNPENPLQVTFSTNLMEGSDYLWDFGDGSTSSDANPTHVYEFDGVFRPSVTVETADGEVGKGEFKIELVASERYKIRVFSNVLIEKGQYGNGTFNQYEFFLPEDDYMPGRPLIVLAPGGNFQDLTRKETLRGMCLDMARRGYAVAMIDYAQAAVPANSSLQTYTDLFIEAIGDYRTAIRYFRSNANDLGIDPDKIYIGGWSTGSVLALTSAYMKQEDGSEFADSRLAIAVEASIDKLGGLGDDVEVSSQPNAVFAMMPYLFDLSMLDPSIPLLMINNVKAVTTFDCQLYLEEITLTFGDGPLTTYGSDLIAQTAVDKGMGEDQLEYLRSEYWQDDWQECDWYPNVSIMSSDNYPQIAEFFYNLQ